MKKIRAILAALVLTATLTATSAPAEAAYCPFGRQIVNIGTNTNYGYFNKYVTPGSGSHLEVGTPFTIKSIHVVTANRGTIVFSVNTSHWGPQWFVLSFYGYIYASSWVCIQT